MLEKIRYYLNLRIEYRRWEVVKYALIALCIVLPCLGRVVHYVTASCTATFVAFYCLCFGALMLLRVPRKWTIPLIVIGIFGVAYQMGLGKPLGYQTLTAMYETNYREILGFFSSPASILLAVVGAAVLLFVLWLLAGDKPLPRCNQPTFIRRKYLLPFLLVSAVLFSFTKWRIFETYPLCLFYENFMYIDENITISDYLSTPYQCPDRYLKTVPPDDTFVLIIGEAARRGSLSAYGYSRKTTPRLDACLQKHPSNVLLYTDAITTAAFTKASVMSIYSPLTVPEELTALHSRPGLSKIFRGSGFQTLYVTTRPKYDLRNMLSTFLDDAETRAYLTTHLKRAYDEEVIPVVMDFLASHPGKRMIVLQLMGSHIEYGAQYPKTHRWFHSGDRLRDTYDDSIRYADYAIHELMDRLLARPEPVCALYVSDHGENLNDLGDGNRGHGTRTLTPYELKTPFVLYFNDAFLKKHGDAVARLRERKDQPVCHDHIAHTFMGLAGIGDPFVYRPSWDLSSPDFRVNPRIVTDENMRPADYTALDFSGKKKIEQFGEMMAEKYRSKFTW